MKGKELNVDDYSDMHIMYMYLLPFKDIERNKNLFMLKIGYNFENTRDLDNEYKCKQYLLDIKEVIAESEEHIFHKNLQKRYPELYYPVKISGKNKVETYLFDEQIIKEFEKYESKSIGLKKMNERAEERKLEMEKLKVENNKIELAKLKEENQMKLAEMTELKEKEQIELTKLNKMLEIKLAEIELAKIQKINIEQFNENKEIINNNKEHISNNKINSNETNNSDPTSKPKSKQKKSTKSNVWDLGEMDTSQANGKFKSILDKYPLVSQLLNKNK